MGRKRDEPTATVAALPGLPAWLRYSRLCGVCGTSFTVNVPAAHGEITGTLGCPVCATRC